VGKKDKKKKKDKEKKGKFDEAAGDEEEVQREKKEKIDLAALNRVNLNDVEGHTPFSYQDMLDQIIKQVASLTSGEDGAAGVFKLFEPQCSRNKTKSSWNNFDEQAVSIGRDHKHILDYFLSELGCSGNLGANNEMVLVGNYQAKVYLRLIRKYIEDYVRCANCRLFNTEIKKEDRLTSLRCKKCKASRTVTAIANRF